MSKTIDTQIVFKGMDRSAALENDIRARANKLVQFDPRILRCRVAVQAPHQHQRQGRQFKTDIQISLPGKDIFVSHEPGNINKHEDPCVCVHDAFDAARRQLQDNIRKMRGRVKHHESVSQHGQILELFPAMDYGTIRTAEGREIYFHRNAVRNGEFDRLDEGAQLRFTEEMGEKGPQAAAVYLGNSD